jgi:hypothetical protein
VQRAGPEETALNALMSAVLPAAALFVVSGGLAKALSTGSAGAFALGLPLLVLRTGGEPLSALWWVPPGARTWRSMRVCVCVRC